MIQSEVFFREVALKILSNLDIGEALKEAFNFMKNHIPMDMMGMYQLSDYGETGVKVFSVARYGFGKILPEPAFPGEPIIRMSKNDAKILKEFESKYPGLVKFDNGGNFPIQLLKMFPSIDNCSLLKMDIQGENESKCSLLIAKRGTGIYNSGHAELVKAVHRPFSIAMGNALRYRELMQIKENLASENLAMKSDLDRTVSDQIVGADFGLRQVMEMVGAVARTTSPVLLLGETGTGKELIAKSIHQTSPRRDGPFIAVQCGAMPESLLDSELFGHEKGSYTGAVSSKKGRFERADGGTIFLDEIGELSMDAQIKLLRVLQEKEFEKVGGQQTIKVDVRIIAATHRNLHRMVGQGSFREDLWFRLNVFPITIPPLRERKADIPALVQHFILKKSRELNLPLQQELASGTIDRMMAYNWPGNVRELQNLIERALIISSGKPLDIQSEFSREEAFIKPAVDKGFIKLESLVKNHLLAALELAHGRIEGTGGAADLLDINPSTLRSKLRKFKIPFGKKL
jgi:transcriptional regulator with GAF, ATPase, and Fis domain